MAMYLVRYENEVEADSPEDAAIIVRDGLRTGAMASIFVVNVAGGQVVVDTELGNESVFRDDRPRIGPVILRSEGPTGFMTSTVLAKYYGHDRVDSQTELEHIDGKWLRLIGCGDDAYYQWIGPDGKPSEPFAVITVQRNFASPGVHPTTHLALAAYGANSQH